MQGAIFDSAETLRRVIAATKYVERIRQEAEVRPLPHQVASGPTMCIVEPTNATPSDDGYYVGQSVLKEITGVSNSTDWYIIPEDEDEIRLVGLNDEELEVGTRYIGMVVGYLDWDVPDDHPDDQGRMLVVCIVPAGTTPAASVVSWKEPVRVATTANGSLASAFENGDTVDGITLVTGDRILIKNQTTATENGIYTVNASGAPTRADDANTGSELLGAVVWVSEGTTNKDSIWACTTDASISIGSTNIVWEPVHPRGQYRAVLTGGDYTLTTTMASLGSPITVTVPAGTYDVIAIGQFDLETSSGNSEVQMAVYNETDVVNLTGSVGAIGPSVDKYKGTLVIQSRITLSASKSIGVRAATPAGPTYVTRKMLQDFTTLTLSRVMAL